ncbi:MAG: hypothetical protein JWO42_1065 [Chloroflexi bacterium]|nr:hypothetical protein [Chloroflexota bacterium]
MNLQILHESFPVIDIHQRCPRPAYCTLCDVCPVMTENRCDNEQQD